MILIYGFYDKGNIGDELFRQSFCLLFPNQDLKFVSHLVDFDVTEAKIIIFGGGSFLGGKLSASFRALELLPTKTIFYLGVGVEVFIDPIHEKLLAQAKLVIIRSPEQLIRIQNINPSTIFLPDLAYVLQLSWNKPRTGILFVPNFLVVPKNQDPYWKHVSWNYFKSEFSQFLDYLIAEKHHVNILSMCYNDDTRDHQAGVEIVNMMDKGSKISFLDSTVDNVQEQFASVEFVITQRFHGIILSEMTQTPYLAIAHHDKLLSPAPMNGSVTSYYGVRKNDLIKCFTDRSSQNMLYEVDKKDYFDMAAKVLDLASAVL